MSEGGRSPVEAVVSSSGVTWRFRADGIAEVLLDTPGEKVNLLDRGALAALDDAFASLQRRPDLAGVLVASAKPGVFVAGADVRLIASVRSAAEGRDEATSGQRVFQALANLRVPTVAAISGACLGGGCEMALACTARVAADSEEVQIGLPEVRLGIIPGWGGTQRLPLVVGLPAALDLILTGRSLTAREALRIGLVDAVVPPERLLAEGRRIALDLARRGAAGGPGGSPAGRSAGGGARALPWRRRILLRPPARGLILGRAAAAARRRGGGHYPAPEAAVEAIGAGLSGGLDAGFSREAELVGRLVAGEVGRNLVRIFLWSRETGTVPAAGVPAAAGAGSGAAAAPPARAAVRPVRRVGVLGAGVMGGAIAAVAAGKGISVRLRDVGPGPLARGLAEAHGILSGRGRRRRPPDWTLSRFLKIEPATALSGFAAADLVVEAVFEDQEVKRRALAEIEAAVPEDCILASNTSSLSIDALASALRRPERLVGLHFFNPADRMPLVEVVRGPRSDPECVAGAAAFARAIGKTPVVVTDSPGFVVNRLLMPYLAEALLAVAEGEDVERVDRRLVRFGMPVGPLALLDQIGLDVAAKVSRVLAAAFEDRLPSPAPLEAMVQAGWLGDKSGAGFYVRRGGRRRINREAAGLIRRSAGGAPKTPGGEDLVRRLLYPVVNEAARLLEEGAVEAAPAVDLAMVFGTGFPPFLGGPLRWADSLGAAAVAGELAAMAARRGARLAPCALLARMAETGAKFHA